MIGQTLSHFRITAKLGEGGMGEVYRAEDTKLKRDVALKILPPELSGSQERLERFQREAETLAALDHPNIVTIHSVEEVAGVHFLTMQLIEGKRLSDLIPPGGMPLDRIFEIAIPLADALAAAHEKGVIHRDLKPGNVMVAGDGRVKVLDFGLAKLRYGSAEAGGTELPTEPLTDEGRVLGTVLYMSPEQVEGRPLDHRSDLFSLGVMLYEMATGKRPFQGDSPASTMSAILRDTPSSVIDLKADLPRDLAKIIRRCLVKQPERRFQTARELAIELEELCSEVASGEAWGLAAAQPSRGRVAPWAGWTAAGIVLVTAIAVVLWVTRRVDQSPMDDGPITASTTFTRLVFDTFGGRVSASPGGRFFTYVDDASGNRDIYLRRIEGGRTINLTEDSDVDDYQPAFSPDGEWIAFRSERDGGGIFIMGATGESVRRITNQGYHPGWSPDGRKIVFSISPASHGSHVEVDDRILTAEVTTGEIRTVIEGSVTMPSWSPDGRWIAYLARGLSEVYVIPAAGGEPIRITDDGNWKPSVTWSPDGRSLYFVSDRGGADDLWRVRIDKGTGRALGKPMPMTSGSNIFSVSVGGERGQIFYTSMVALREILRVPFDPAAETIVGPPVSITPPDLRARHPKVSPDGEWIAFDAEFGGAGNWDIGVVRKDGSSLREVTHTLQENSFFPHWSPDGQRLSFSSSGEAWVINHDGGGLRQLTGVAGGVRSPVWSPDGERLAASSKSGDRTFVFEAEGSPGEELPVLPPIGDPEDRFDALSWSPDGKYLAGVHWRAGEFDSQQVALYSFETESYRIISEELGVLWPTWLNDSRRLLVTTEQLIHGGGVEDGRVFILDAESGDTRDVLSSKALSAEPNTEAGSLVMLGVSPDNESLYIHWYYTKSDIWMLTLGEQE